MTGTLHSKQQQMRMKSNLALRAGYTVPIRSSNAMPADLPVEHLTKFVLVDRFEPPSRSASRSAHRAGPGGQGSGKTVAQ